MIIRKIVLLIDLLQTKTEVHFEYYIFSILSDSHNHSSCGQYISYWYTILIESQSERKEFNKI